MTSSIPSETEELLAGIDEGASGSMILIHKTKHKDLAKRFRTLPVEICDDIADAFKESAKLALEDVRDNAESITTFSDPANANSYVEMDTVILPDLDALLGELRRQDGYHGSHDFDEVKEKGISCFILKSGPLQKRAFVFFNVGKNHLRPDKYIVSKITGDGLRLDKDRLVVFESRAFAVYYEDLQRLLIIRYRSTKKLLNFNEQFRARCRDILTEQLKGAISLETGLGTLLGDNTTNEKMVRMYGGGVFKNADPGAFAKWNRFYDAYPLEGANRIGLGAGGKAVVRSRDDLALALRVLNNDYVEAVNARGIYALATGKKELKVSRPGAAAHPPRRAATTGRKSARGAARGGDRPSSRRTGHRSGSGRGVGARGA